MHNCSSSVTVRIRCRRGRRAIRAGRVRLMICTINDAYLHNCLGCFFWFKSRLHFHAEDRHRPARRIHRLHEAPSLLRSLEGWDETCLTRDADIGLVGGAPLHKHIRVICPRLAADDARGDPEGPVSARTFSRTR